MTTIQMNTGTGRSGTHSLPAPSGALISVTNGIAAVNCEDVRIAMAAGWTIQAGQNWPAAELKRMAKPASDNWPANGSITSPDGQSITVTNGIALVPIAWVSYYTSLGWYSL